MPAISRPDVNRTLARILKQAPEHEGHVLDHDRRIRLLKSPIPIVRERKERRKNTKTTTQKSTLGTGRDNVFLPRGPCRYYSEEISDGVDSYV